MTLFLVKFCLFDHTQTVNCYELQCLLIWKFLFLFIERHWITCSYFKVDYLDCFVLNFFNVKIYDLVWISAPVVSNHIEGEQIQINCIAIAKCDLYFHYHHVKEISFYHFCDTKLCVKHKCVCKCPFIFLGIMFVSRVISEQITSRSR